MPTVPRLAGAADASTLVILRCGDAAASVVEQHGDFPDWIAAPLRAEWRGPIVEVEMRADAAPPDVSRAAGLVVSGSSSSVTERAPWMLRAEAVLRAAVARRQPILGICFGHQLLAKALGGDVGRNPAGREIGTVEVRRLAHDPLLDDLDDVFDVNATHVDTVTTLPVGAVALAETALERTAAFALERARGVQFHPEIDGPVMRGYLDARREVIEAEGLPYASLRERARDTHAGPRILRNFVRGFVAAR